jgi:hypothetical protein
LKAIPIANLSPGCAVAMKSELKRLRKENNRLRMEHEILKKAAAFFVKESGYNNIDTCIIMASTLTEKYFDLYRYL